MRLRHEWQQSRHSLGFRFGTGSALEGYSAALAVTLPSNVRTEPNEACLRNCRPRGRIVCLCRNNRCHRWRLLSRRTPRLLRRPSRWKPPWQLRPLASANVWQLWLFVELPAVMDTAKRINRAINHDSSNGTLPHTRHNPIANAVACTLISDASIF